MPAPFQRTPRRPSERASHARDRRRTALLQAVTAALSRAATPEDVARATVDVAMRAAGAIRGALWTLSVDRDEAVLVHSCGYPREIVERFRRVPLSNGSQVPIAECLVRHEPLFLGSR
ncbi:MAG TPA: histidine kinase, partial [Anaeromyxobacteraceae bacterium]|nr:histidine kinase [Anaeromyxobacteraceae bacterium]